MILRLSVAYSLYLLTGEEVVYLDPHTTQEAGSGIHKKSAAGEEEQEEGDVDASYHCPLAQRMPFLHLDPSLALVGTPGGHTVFCVFNFLENILFYSFWFITCSKVFCGSRLR